MDDLLEDAAEIATWANYAFMEAVSHMEYVLHVLEEIKRSNIIADFDDCFGETIRVWKESKPVIIRASEAAEKSAVVLRQIHDALSSIEIIEEPLPGLIF